MQGYYNEQPLISPSDFDPQDDGSTGDVFLLTHVISVNQNGDKVYLSLPMLELAKEFDVLPNSNLKHRTTASIFRDLKIFSQFEKNLDENLAQDDSQMESSVTPGYPKWVIFWNCAESRFK